MRRIDIRQLSERDLILNVYITQAIVLAVACFLLWRQGRLNAELWQASHWSVGLWGLGAGFAVVAIDLALSRLFPRLMVDDSGINEKLFRNRPLWHIALMTLIIALCEELLFRGALQPVIGIYWTSVLFALVHFRYLRQWLMTVFVFMISLALGAVFIVTGSLIAPAVAHFVIDFTLAVLLKSGRLDHWVRTP